MRKEKDLTQVLVPLRRGRVSAGTGSILYLELDNFVNEAPTNLVHVDIYSGSAETAVNR